MPLLHNYICVYIILEVDIMQVLFGVKCWLERTTAGMHICS